jgi:peptidoglycan/xylan/chitin deacetylase (PgdA/CDA1 family)
MHVTKRSLGLVVSRYCGVQKLLRLTSRGPIVLFYHGVDEKIVDPDVQRLHMPLRDFERQIRFLRRHREIVSMDYLYECVVNNHLQDPKQVVLTFDDGYKTNARIVAPLLHAWRIPFTVFISTRHISEHRRFGAYYVRAAIHHTRSSKIQLSSIGQTFDLTTRVNRLAAESRITRFVKRAPQNVVDQIIAECIALIQPDEWSELNARFTSDEPMNWEDANYIQSIGGTIGSHCYDHCILHANQPEQVVHQQLRLSKEAIEQNVAECKYFSYPNGTLDDISKATYSAVKATQFRLCFSTIEGEFTPEVDRHLAPRFWAVPDYEEFCYTLSQTGRQNRSYFDSCRTMQTGELAFGRN